MSGTFFIHVQREDGKHGSYLQIRRLASMAIRAYDSPWSDAAHDLCLGTKDVLGREPEES